MAQERSALDTFGQLQLAGKVTDPATQRDTGSPWHGAEYLQLASRGANYVHEHSKRGRLARTVRPDQPEHRTPLDPQADPIDGEMLAVLLL